MDGQEAQQRSWKSLSKLWVSVDGVLTKNGYGSTRVGFQLVGGGRQASWLRSVWKDYHHSWECSASYGRCLESAGVKKYEWIDSYR